MLLWVVVLQGRWGAHTNPGSNCELNALVATLSTGPVGIADKAGDTNATLVRRCVRADGRILQPDKPATAVDSMFAGAQRTGLASSRATQGDDRADGGGRVRRVRRAPPPTGHVWATSTTLPTSAGAGVGQGVDGRGSGSTSQANVPPAIYHYVLSVDVTQPWHIHGDDFYPKMPTPQAQPPASPAASPSGWVAHPWFTGHAPTPCVHGVQALASGCITASVATASNPQYLLFSYHILVYMR